MFFAHIGFVLLLFSFANCESNPIAFTVGQDSHLSLTNATVIPFAVGITNNANANIHNGVFTCTSAGLYKFQVYSLTQSNTQLFLELYHNNALVASLWGYTNGDYAAAGNAVVLKLAAGDTVKVQSNNNYTVSLYGTPNEVYTTFTGVQLGSHDLGTIDPGQSTLEAMSVTLTHHIDVNGSDPVLYNNVLVDTGNGYDVISGVYTVPSAGLYLFHFFSLDRAGLLIYQDLYRNNNYVCSIYGLTDSAFSDDGNSVILHLAAGDQMTVKARPNRVNNLYGDPAQIYSSFSGVQLVTEEGLASTGEVPFVSFSAGLAHSYSVTAGAAVVFDRIFTNIQHAYNLVTGEFDAPVSGVYEFNYHALGQKDSSIWLELYHNYQYVNSLYDHTPGYYAAAGNAAVLKLDAGDIVHVRAHRAGDLYGANDQIYCTFSGYLLYSSNNDNVIVG